MATWQFNFSFVPMNDLSGTIKMDEDGLFDFSSFWLKNQPPENYRELIAKILLHTRSWSQDILMFGKEDNTCIDVSLENNYVVDISVRIDLRTFNMDLMKKIVDLAKLFKCSLFLYETNELIESNSQILFEKIKNSNAAKFVIDPRKFLDEIDLNKFNDIKKIN
ncbi:MAG TPA: hypothetical protein VK870_06765 [Ignavibacteriaceae bacterium]|nr:hypothetical protein [Ignavibacteriaceae bacterium]